ncbi:MAG: response regulator [Magnetococcus sp. YQC-5]
MTMQDLLAGKKVLLVEDDSALQELLLISFELEEMDVLGASDGEEAIALLQKGHPDLIVMDLMMPKMDGFLFLRWLRREIRVDLPVLVLSAVRDTQLTDELLALGRVRLLTKPVNIPDLLTAMRQLLVV